LLYYPPKEDPPCTRRRTLPELIQDAIDRGSTTVEDIHKSIADLPLKILEESDLLRSPAKEAKRVQDHTVGAIYDVIREVNEEVGTFASELLAEAAARRAARAAEVHKPRSSDLRAATARAADGGTGSALARAASVP
jgi:hypothetical protein